MADKYEYTGVDAERAAWIAAFNHGQDGQVEAAQAIGKIKTESTIPTFVVYLQGTAFSHDYSYPVDEYLSVTWDADNTAIIDEVTDKQIEEAYIAATSLEDVDVDDETAAIERLGDQAYYII